MNKQQAQSKLNDLQKEVDSLRKIIEEPENIMDRVKTMDDVYWITGKCIASSNAISLSKDELAYIKLRLIADALNEGWKPDWNNDKQKKWFPWFEYKSGFSFSFTAYDFWSTYAGVGSRLCFHSSELAEYAGKQFTKEYNDFLSL